MSERYGIVAIGYNRPKSLKRLLEALNNADYQNYTPLLIISLDYSGNVQIAEIAQKFQWKCGEKIVKSYKERQGLRAHVLKCGDYIEEYQLDAIAVFEDDIVPSPAFFNYMVQAVGYYENDMEIAGISLYTHLWNVNQEMPFQPLLSSADVFFLQFAQSWGQIWMRRQWREFKEWYLANSADFFQADGVPTAVCNWKDSSWLKYHIRYCVEKNRYFVYPYESLCTNFTDAGVHNTFSTTLYQVPIQLDSVKNYMFVKREEISAVYDVHFENECLAQYFGVPIEELCVDLYGGKGLQNKRYWLTTQKADYAVAKTYGLRMKPQELNIILGIEGTEIKLYDTRGIQKETKQGLSLYKKYDYYFRFSHCSWKELLKLLLHRILIKALRR